VLFIEKIKYIPAGSHLILLVSPPGYLKNVVVVHRNGRASK